MTPYQQYSRCFGKIKPGDKVLIWLDNSGQYSNQKFKLSEPLLVAGTSDHDDYGIFSILLETNNEYGFPHARHDQYDYFRATYSPLAHTHTYARWTNGSAVLVAKVIKHRMNNE